MNRLKKRSDTKSYAQFVYLLQVKKSLKFDVVKIKI